MSNTQVTLAPETAFDPAAPAAYATVRWRWEFAGEASAWFATRDLALADAAARWPGIGAG